MMSNNDRWDQEIFFIIANGLDRSAEFAAKKGIQFEVRVDLTKDGQKERHVFRSREDGYVVTPNPNQFDATPQ
jgi:hypothetical protein